MSEADEPADAPPRRRGWVGRALILLAVMFVGYILSAAPVAYGVSKLSPKTQMALRPTLDWVYYPFDEADARIYSFARFNDWYFDFFF